MPDMSTDRTKVQFGIKAAYGTGAVADGVKNAVFNSFLLFYYTGVLGLPGSLAGPSLFLAMCFDAVSDLLVGYLSDHTHSKLGRRHPYMYAAAIPMGISIYFLLWTRVWPVPLPPLWPRRARADSSRRFADPNRFLSGSARSSARSETSSPTGRSEC